MRDRTVIRWLLASWLFAIGATVFDWMSSKELNQAIPPLYCEFIGAQLLAHVQARTAA